MINALSIDLEDWFHIIGIDSNHKKWDKYPSRVEYNTRKILTMIEDKGIKATFFVLGWVAKRYPSLIKKISDKGHEIATHGYSHDLISNQTRDEFRHDIRKSLDILEKITNKKILGYRAPSFSLTNERIWAFDILAENGIIYDSSIFPSRRFDGGIQSGKYSKSKINRIKTTVNSDITEFPMSVMKTSLFNIPFSGGGYFRFLPYFVTSYLIKKHNEKGQPFMFYLHPRDLDPNQPRLKMNMLKNFRIYYGLESCEKKFKRLLNDFQFGRVIDILKNY